MVCFYFFILGVLLGSSVTNCEKIQTISFIPDGADDTIQVIQKGIEPTCRNDDRSAMDLSNTGLKTLSPKNINNFTITCINLAENEIQRLPDNIFASEKLSKLTYLNLAHNHIPLEKLSSFGSHNNLKTLVFDGQESQDVNSNLTFGSTTIFPQLEVLSIRDRSITFLTSNFSSLFPRLTHLYASDNTLSDIFEALPESLTHLYLERNKLKENLRFFNMKRNIKVLFLDGNYFRTFSIDRAYTNGNLQVLSLTHCKINTFVSFTNLKLISLDLSFNELSTLNSNMFINLRALQNFSLNHNFLTEIPVAIELKSLKVLSLGHNQIQSIDATSLKQFTNLQVLSLRGNSISRIDVNTFAALSNLQKLDLAENKLSSLPANWIKSLNQLRFLNLNLNHFATTEALSLPSDHLLENLYLRNNTIKGVNIKSLQILPKGLRVNVALMYF